MWTYTLKQRSLPAARVLAVTEYEGILYVRGDTILRELGHSDLSLGLDILATEANTHHVEDVHIDVKVSIFNTGKACSKFFCHLIELITYDTLCGLSICMYS